MRCWRPRWGAGRRTARWRRAFEDGPLPPIMGRGTRGLAWAALKAPLALCSKGRNNRAVRRPRKRCRIYYRSEGASARPLLVLAHSLSADHGWDHRWQGAASRFQVLRWTCAVTGSLIVPAGDYNDRAVGYRCPVAVDSAGRDRFAHRWPPSLGGMIGQWLEPMRRPHERLYLRTRRREWTPACSRRVARPCWRRVTSYRGDAVMQRFSLARTLAGNLPRSRYARWPLVPIRWVR